MEQTEPEGQWFEKPIKTTVYKVANGWYLEVVVKHPDNPELPDQLMTIKCDNEWWARFLNFAIVSLAQRDDGLSMFDEAAPEFRYEG